MRVFFGCLHLSPGHSFLFESLFFFFFQPPGMEVKIYFPRSPPILSSWIQDNVMGHPPPIFPVWDPLPSTSPIRSPPPFILKRPPPATLVFSQNHASGFKSPINLLDAPLSSLFPAIPPTGPLASYVQTFLNSLLFPPPPFL